MAGPRSFAFRERQRSFGACQFRDRVPGNRFRLEQDIFPDKMPWLRRRLAKEDILKLTVEDLEPVAEKGLMPDCRRYIEFYRKRLNGTPVKIYLPDTQGPFDIAHLVLGDSIFTELYDDPEFVRHLLTLSAYVYRAASRIIKQWTGEPATGGCHGNGLYLSGCGVRACEDTTTLLSPDLIAVVAPFIQEALEPFNGWVHFCGSGQNLLDRILRLPAVKGVNFGNPEKYPWKEVIAQIVSAGRVYYGFAARNEKEPLSGYFERVLSSLKTKGNLIFIPAVNPDEPTGETVTLWRKAQDRCFGR